MGDMVGKTAFFSNDDLGAALRLITEDMAQADGGDPTDLMSVGTDLIAYRISRVDHHAATSKGDVNSLMKEAFEKASNTFAQGGPLTTAFDYGVFKGLIFGGMLKYIAKLGRLDKEAKDRVTVVVSGIATGVSTASGVAPVAAAIVGAGVGSLGAVITTYIMKERDLRSAGLKLIGAFLADWRRGISPDPEERANEMHDWEEAKNGLEMSLLCPGLR